MTLYGFSTANTSNEPAWFTTPEKALAFARHCWDRPLLTDDPRGGDRDFNENDLETIDSDEVDENDIVE